MTSYQKSTNFVKKYPCADGTLNYESRSKLHPKLSIYTHANSQTQLREAIPVNFHKCQVLLSLGSIRCKHNTRWQYLSRMKDRLLAFRKTLLCMVKKVAGYHPDKCSHLRLIEPQESTICCTLIVNVSAYLPSFPHLKLAFTI